MKNIITIQHTQSIHHTNGMIGAWTDWELTELGKQQADSIGRALKKQLSDTTNYTMYASDLLRTKQTAEIVSKYLNLRPIYRTELREINLGSATGKSIKWLHKNQQEYNSNTSLLDFKCLPDAESKRDFYHRLLPFINEIENSPEENIIIVSHGGTLSMLFTMWIYGDISGTKDIAFQGISGGVSFLKKNDQGMKIIQKLNDLSYLINHA
ncbi:histidine phosphatase family protein [Mycoplasmatota bacterium]|nr:histidine phosphatase family protein [Mycoplasmatota bacterium]